MFMKILIVLLLIILSSPGFTQDESIKIPEFTGYVGAPDDDMDNMHARFNDFILNNEGNVVYIEVILDDDQHAAFKDPTEDFYFFAVYDDYPDKLSGIEYHIIRSKTPASFGFDPDSKTVDGHYRIENITGPQNGLFTADMIRVKKLK